MTDASDASTSDRWWQTESLARLIETMVAVELSGVMPAGESALDAEYLADLQDRVTPVLSLSPGEVDAEALLIAALNLWADRP